MPEVPENILIIILNKNKFTIINKEDFIKIEPYTWICSTNGYVISTTGIFMHCLIMGLPPGKIDHINLDKLDNRRCNLRILETFSQNLMNTPLRNDNTVGFKGVSMRRNKYRATINLNKKQKHLGDFLIAKDAAHAYDNAARIHFGEFARLNFPLPGERGALKNV